MDNTGLSKNDKSLGMAIHLSTFLKYFFPFGNFIAPLILWTTNREKPFIDHNGREAINFQLSLLLYGVIIAALCLPFVFFYAGDFISIIEHLDDAYYRSREVSTENLGGYLTVIFLAVLVAFCIFIFEIYAVISAAMKANNGEEYRYPLCIRFIKTDAELVFNVDAGVGEGNTAEEENSSTTDEADPDVDFTDSSSTNEQNSSENEQSS